MSEIVIGTTSVTKNFELHLAADNTEITGKVAADITFKYYRQGASAVVDFTSSLNDLVALNTAWNAGGIKEIAYGDYRIDYPDAMFVAGADWVKAFVLVSGSFVFIERFDLEAAAPNVTVVDFTAPALAKFFTLNTTKTIADAIAGSVVYETSANAILKDGAAHGGTPGSSTATLALQQVQVVNPTSAVAFLIDGSSPSNGAMVIQNSANGIGFRVRTGDNNCVVFQNSSITNASLSIGGGAELLANDGSPGLLITGGAISQAVKILGPYSKPGPTIQILDGGSNGGNIIEIRSINGECYTIVAKGTLAGTVADATNTTPIVVTSLSHGLVTGDTVTITGATGNTAANVAANAITVVDVNNYSLDGTIGNGAYDANSGKWISNRPAHGVHSTGAINGDGFHGVGLGTGVGFLSTPAATGFGGGTVDANVVSMAANVLTSTVIDTSAVNALADGLLGRVDGIETGYTPRAAWRLGLSADAAKTSGANTTTFKARDINDSKDRITATVDAFGNRSTVTTDVT